MTNNFTKAGGTGYSPRRFWRLGLCLFHAMFHEKRGAVSAPGQESKGAGEATPGRHHPTNGRGIDKQAPNTQQRLPHRLHRDYPALAARLDAGELSPNTAVVQMGRRRSWARFALLIFRAWLWPGWMLYWLIVLEIMGDPVFSGEFD